MIREFILTVLKLRTICIKYRIPFNDLLKSLKNTFTTIMWDGQNDRKIIIKIHGNCSWYKYHTSKWSKKNHGIGGCINRGMADLRYMNLHPLDEGCECFDGAKELGSQHYFWER